MDLFDYMREQNMEKEAPLASRLRPTTLEEVVGQQHIIGKDKLLIQGDQGGQTKFSHFLWSSGNWKDNAGESDCQHDQCGIYADQCNG